MIQGRPLCYEESPDGMWWWQHSVLGHAKQPLHEEEFGSWKSFSKVQGSSHTSLLFRGPSWTKPMMSSHYISQFIEDTIQQNPFTRPKLDSKQEQWAITKARLWWFEMQKLCWIDQMHEPRTSSQPTRIDRMMEFAKLQTNIKICSTSITCSNTILKPHQNCSSYKGNQILIESILKSGIQSICLQLNSS